MADRPRYPRTGCVVPFCRRTSTLFPSEWICGDHWRLVDRSLKMFRTKRLKAAQRNRKRWERLERATWRRMKRQAIERALGL